MGMFSPWSWVYELRLAPFRAKYFGLEAVPSLALILALASPLYILGPGRAQTLAVYGAIRPSPKPVGLALP